MFRIEIAPELCNGCLYCVRFCPKKVLGPSGKLNSKGYEYMTAVDAPQCVGCKTCTDVCPDAAITLIRE